MKRSSMHPIHVSLSVLLLYTMLLPCFGVSAVTIMADAKNEYIMSTHTAVSFAAKPFLTCAAVPLPCFMKPHAHSMHALETKLPSLYASAKHAQAF